MTWICQNGKTCVGDDNFGLCWQGNCAKGVTDPSKVNPSHSFSNARLYISKPCSVSYKVFRSTFASWNKLFTSASELVSALQPE
ncbi:hypothetical protein [Thalassomonas haliotis]|uniref:Uncharacterized protein n=1 Tax=Thalassomonas haliotis TaxID=485448 RepID=A0ABY7VHL2_9GAMM|nr:hypothetical protein [Thalassomonas haliotis]WDE12714.1 hypothetical protein H3N35_04375 [Thalassomonas haliotis]